MSNKVIEIEIATQKSAVTAKIAMALSGGERE